jgi:hypothetical protein
VSIEAAFFGSGEGAFFGSGEDAFFGSGESAFLGSGEGAFLGRGETAGRAGFCEGEGPILTRFSAWASSEARLLFNDFGDCGRGGRGCLIGGLMV